MKKMFPVLTILLGAFGGSAVGLFMFMQAALPIVRELAAKRAEETHAVEIPKKPWDFWTLEIDKLSDELEARIADLDKREGEVAAREERLAAAAQETQQARSEIDSLRKALAKNIGEIQASEAKNIRTLAATYADMKPNAAIPIFRELSDDTIVKILSVWKPDNVRPLLDEISKNANLDPDLVRRAGLWTERLRLLPRATAPAKS
jgi:flagellar motility protein MotE (MotC chaperone)